MALPLSNDETARHSALAHAAAKIRSLGQQISPAILAELKTIYAPLQPAPQEGVWIERDLSYGAHERHKLNLFRPRNSDPVDVFIFVHGGAFVSGDKDETPGAFYDNTGRWAASQGMLGATLNYRLAPGHLWPAGRDDLAAAVSWLYQNAAQHGGNPRRIFLAGHSAGAAHVAAYMSMPGTQEKIAGGICISGVYDLSIPPVNTTYFGSDEALYAERSSLPGLAETSIPLLVVISEHDPGFIQQHCVNLLSAILHAKAKLPRFAQIQGHNHFSTILHLNSPDTSLADQLLSFIRSPH